MTELELLEENSESCPSGATTPGIPLWMMMAVGAVMVVGIVSMGDDKPAPGLGGLK